MLFKSTSGVLKRCRGFDCQRVHRYTSTITKFSEYPKTIYAKSIYLKTLINCIWFILLKKLQRNVYSNPNNLPDFYPTLSFTLRVK